MKSGSARKVSSCSSKTMVRAAVRTFRCRSASQRRTLAKTKMAIGVRLEASPLVNLKVQVERQRETHWHEGAAHRAGGTALRMQLAYGF